MKRYVYYISDGTGITAEMLGHSLLTQFSHDSFEAHTIPFIDNVEKAAVVVEKINRSALESNLTPIVFSTIVAPHVREVLRQANASVLDFFDTFMPELQKTLNQSPSMTIGRTHSADNLIDYKTRMDAINYTLTTDDGVNVHEYNDAELIMIGVSRCGKTPTCLYLALQYGIFTANLPLTDDDLEHSRLPSVLVPFKHKCFGLTIEPQRLQAIRHERRPNSAYAELAQCKHEIRCAEALFHREKIPYLNTTHLSIEEIAAKILVQMGIERRLK